MSDTTPVVLTIDELWLLHSVIKHEMPQEGTWKYPPASLDMNDRICDAIIFCDDQTATEAAMEMSRGDLLCIDYCVPQDAKTPGGVMIGKKLLMKAFRARCKLARADDDPLINLVDVEAVESISTNEVQEAMTRFEQVYTETQARKEKEDAKPRTSTNPNARRRTKRSPVDNDTHRP